MPALDLALFTGATDEEMARYHVLGGLQRVRRAFAATQVYPHLAELIRLRAALRQIADEAQSLRERRPGTLSGIDLDAGRLLYEKPEAEWLLFEALIDWALPLIEEVIEEGRTLYEFVDEHSRVETVGIVPAYQDEGYLLVPDARAARLRVLRYAVALFTRAEERYRSLRTAEIAEAPADAPPQEVKRALIAQRPDLPNPATYRLETDLDFPVEETVLPVAKRKLLQYLAVGGTTGRA